MSDAAILSIVSSIITVIPMIVGFLTLWVKLRYGVEQATAAKENTDGVKGQIDDNTAVTKAGLVVAATNAQAAVGAATEAHAAVEQMGKQLSKKLNGGIDSAIAGAVDPIRVALAEHAARVDGLEKYIHDRNHDLLDALHTQSTKVDLLIETIKRGRPPQNH